MIQQLKPAFVLFTFLALLTGLLYPLTVTSIAQAAFPFQANGSLIEKDGTLLGSRLIGQNFTGSQYFWGRPSATAGSPYNSFDPAALTGSSGSNLGPLSRALVDTVQTRAAILRAADPDNSLPIPVDLVTASASGLDPHISLAAAYYQLPRVARARSLSEATVIALLNQFVEDRQLGLLGEPRINVLLLNLALDEIK
jgi:K+-transporting ATPase ATPase C chain